MAMDLHAYLWCQRAPQSSVTCRARLCWESSVCLWMLSQNAAQGHASCPLNSPSTMTRILEAAQQCTRSSRSCKAYILQSGISYNTGKQPHAVEAGQVHVMWFLLNNTVLEGA